MNPFRLVPLSLVAALGCSCSTVDTPSGTDRGYSSARFAKTGGTITPQGIEDTPEVNQAVQGAIAAEFGKNGIVFGAPDSDLLVAYMLIRQTATTTTMNSDYFGYGRDPDQILIEAHTRGVIKNKSPDQFEAGAIVIDVLDARSNKLKFRNFAKRDLMEEITPEARKQRITSAVSEALAPFFR